MNIPNRVIRDNIMMINLEQMEFTYGRKNESVDTIEWKEKKGSSISFHAIISTIFQIPYFQAIEVDLVFAILERSLIVTFARD